MLKPAETAVSRSCILCGNQVEPALIVRERVPLFLNQTYPTAADAMRAPIGRFELIYCDACKFAFNGSFDPDRMIYGPGYENEQGHSLMFQHHQDEMIGRILGTGHMHSRPFVEVGCGQGDFLKRLAARPERADVRLYGMDPCYRGAADPRRNLRFLACRVDDVGDASEVNAASTVLLRHVIEHIPRPIEFLKSLLRKHILVEDSHLFLETPALEWIVSNYMFMDLFYEHCSYFSRTALFSLMTSVGCSGVSVDPVFGSQYFWATGVLAPRTGPRSLPATTLSATVMRHFAAAGRLVQANWLDQIRVAATRGPVAIWGAGAKGVTVATLLDPCRKFLECLIDINPLKQGRFIAVSGHLIRSLQDAHRAGVRTAFVVNPNYFEEVRALAGSIAPEIEIRDFAAIRHAI